VLGGWGKPTTSLCSANRYTLGSANHLPLEDGDKPHPYTGGTPLTFPQASLARFLFLAKAPRTQRFRQELFCSFLCVPFAVFAALREIFDITKNPDTKVISMLLHCKTYGFMR